MSQLEVLKILEELGGRARRVDISKKAKEKYPQYSLHLYVSDRLMKLRRSHTIEYDPLTREWFIPNYNYNNNNNNLITSAK